MRRTHEPPKVMQARLRRQAVDQLMALPLEGSALCAHVRSLRQEFSQRLIDQPFGGVCFAHGVECLVARFADDLTGCALAVLDNALFDSLDGHPFLGGMRGPAVLRAAAIIKVSLQRIALIRQRIE